jgi:RNA polymerase sigma-70 factor (ECF subfamily)
VGAGWRALAAAVADVLNELAAGLGTQPAPAAGGAGPLGAVVAHSGSHVDVSPGARPRGRLLPDRSETPTAAPPPATGVDHEHAEVWQLVTLAQQGDGEAFGRLYDRYVDTVFRFIYFRVNDRALAEDFTSETFLRALRRISSISYQGRDIGAWFVTIARNIIFDHMKSARHRLEVTTADTVEGDQRAPSTESAVLDLLTSERLMAAVKQLGDEQRECVMLRFIQGFSVSETAAVMGKNDGAIKALQHRAVRKLAELVGNDLK